MMFTLQQLQQMTRNDFIRAFPQRVSRWRREGYLVDAKKLMQRIVIASLRIPWSATERRGVREFWYNPVKSILLKAIGDRAQTYSQDFSNILSEMVKNGVLRYRDLGIYDFRTMRETYEAIEQAKCWSNILLFIEKDSAYVHLTPLQNLFNINIISGAGWSNTAGIEAILSELRATGIKEVSVYTLTDYDPFGFAIDQEFADKCSLMGLQVSEHNRIGINPQHTTPEILDAQKYPVKRGKKLSVNGISFNSWEWLAEYGIEGRYGIEIEAISGQPQGAQKLREIVADALLEHLEETDRTYEITNPLWKSAPQKAINQILRGYWTVQKPENAPPIFITGEEYENWRDVLTEDMTNATWDIDYEIDELQDQLEELEEQKEEIEAPYLDKLEALRHRYLLSRERVEEALKAWFEQHRDAWKRQDYPMGFPEGCLLQAVKNRLNLQQFIQQADDKRVVSDILQPMDEALHNGEVTRILSKLLAGEGF